MPKSVRLVGAIALAVVLAVLVSACGSSSSSSSSSSSGGASAAGSSSGKKSVTELMGTAPDSLDPQFGYTTQSAESTWVTYLGLLTYGHSSDATAGSAVIPALATAQPVIGDGGKTYTLTLRKGLVYSNGVAVKASDFTYAVERAIKLPWGGSGQFLVGNIVGAKDFSSGKSKTISGITANDSTGQIVIHLLAPYGAFANVLAFPALGLVPSGTPMKNMPNSPPPGVGPYEITNIVPNVSWTLKINPHWAAMSIPGVPSGHVDVNVKVQSNVTTGAEQVLSNQADFFDNFDTVPGTLLSQIQSQASSRFAKVPFNTTYYVFFNIKTKPFSSKLAREAVITAMDQTAFSRLGSGFLAPGCYFLPPKMVGHPTAPCPYGDPAAGGNLAKGKALMQQSGEVGAPVTVWSQTRTPRQPWMTYYTSLLNQLGLKATQKVIADASYFPTVGNLKLNAQTGFYDWNQDFPNPIDFYLLLSGQAILPTNNNNVGQVNDPTINTQINKLGQVPTPQLTSVAGQWQALDEYTAKQAYAGVFGYLTVPKFASTKVNFANAIVSPQYGWDYTSFQPTG